MSNIPSERSLPIEFWNSFSLSIKNLFGRSSDVVKEPFSARKRNQLFRRILSIVLFFGVWQILCMVKFNFWINFSFLPSPIEVSEATVKFFSTNAMIHIQSSVIRVLAGYFFATILGVGLGILIGWFQKLEDLVFLPLELLRPIPAVAWIPLAILMFPDAESGMIYITFIGAFFPILISTIKGVEGVDMLLLRVGQCLGAGQWYVFKDIVVPGRCLVLLVVWSLAWEIAGFAW